MLSVGTLPDGITASVDTSVPGKIAVTLSGPDTVANYQIALAAIHFSNVSDAPSTTDRIITIDVKNTTFGTTSATAISTIHVTAVNDAPVAVNDTGSAPAGAAVTMNVLGNDTDIDDALDPASVHITGTTNPGDSLVVAGEGAWFVNTTTGAITFTPVSGFIGRPTAITYTVADASGDRSVAATVSILPIFTPPHVDLGTETVYTNGSGPGTGAFLFGHQQGNPADRNQASFAVAPANVTQVVGNEIAGAGIAITYSGGTHADVNGAGTATLDGAIAANDYIAMSFTTTAGMPESWITHVTKLNAGGPNYQFAIAISTDGFQTATLLSKDNASPSSGSPNTYAPNYPNFDGADFKLEAGTTYEIRAYIYDVAGGGAATARWDDFYVFFANDPTGSETTFTEGGAAVAITAAGAEIEDAGQTNMVSGNVLLTNKQTDDGFRIGGTVVSSGSSATIDGITYTVTETAGTIEIALSGSATKGAYAALIQSITFENTSEDPATVDRTITVTVSDGVEVSNTALATIHVVPVNDPPVAMNNAYTADEETIVSGDILTDDTGAGIDSDVDGDALVVTLFEIAGITYAADTYQTIPGVGQIYIASGGSFQFYPDADFNGAVPTVTYTVSDGNGETASAALDITITNVPDAPVPLALNIYINEDTPSSPVDRLYAYDADGDTLTYAAGATAPLNGTVLINADGSFTYTPALDFNGTDTFSYSVSDGTTMVEQIVTVTVRPVNDAPEGADNTVTIDEDMTHTFVAADFGFSDPNDVPANNFASVIITTLPITGTLTLAGAPVAAGQVIAVADIGSLVWAPEHNAYGTGIASLTFQVVDDGGSNTANLVINGSLEATPFGGPSTVIPAYSSTTPPAAADLNPAGLEGWTRVVTSYSDGLGNTFYNMVGTNLETDTDPATTDTPFGDQFGFRGHVYQTITGLEPGATYTVSGWAIVQDYDPAIAYDSTVFSVEVYDDAAFNGTIDWNTGYTPPIASETLASWQGEAPTWRQVSFTFTAPASGAIDLVVLKYSAAAAACNWDNIALVKTGDGVDTDPVANTFTFNVDPVNDDFTDDNEALHVDEDTTLTGNLIDGISVDGPVTVTGFEVGGTTYPVTASAPGNVTLPEGELTISSDGTYSFVPAVNYNGTVPTVTYTLTDGSGTDDTSTLDITVDPVNDDFTDGNEHVSVDEDVTISGNLVDGTSVDGPVTITTFEVNGTSYPVTTTTPGSVMLTEGVLTIASDGSYSFVPADNYNGAVPQVTYTLTDASGTDDTSTLDFTITPVNDAPVVIDPANPGTPLNPVQATDPANIIPDVATTDGVTPVDPNVAQYFADPEGDTLSFSADLLPPGLTMAADGTITGTIEPDASQGGNVPGSPGVYLVTITADDGQGGVTTTTVTYSIGNPPPVAVDDTATATEDTAVSGNVLTDVLAGGVADHDTAPDSDPLEVTQFAIDTDGDGTDEVFAAGDTATIAGVGTLTIGPDGAYTFTPSSNYDGAVPVATYTIADGNGGTDHADLTLTITPVNDAPVVIDPANPGTPLNPLQATDPANIIPDVATTDGGTPIDPNVAQYFVDPEGDMLSFSADLLPPGLTMALDGTITGTIEPDASQGGNVPGSPGVYLVTITADDGQGGVTTTTLTYTIDNPPPVAIDDTAIVRQDHAIDIPVMGNDHDPDGDSIHVVAANSANGFVSINSDGTLHFAPAPGFVGEALITYVIADGQAGTATATVRVTVEPEDRSPRLAPQAGSSAPEIGRSLPPSMQVEGAVVAAANGELSAYLDGGLQGSFMSMAGSINSDPPVVAAVNQIVSLGGLQRFSDVISLNGSATLRGSGGGVGHLVRDVAPLANRSSIFSAPAFGRSWASSEPEGLSGFSLRFGDYGPQHDVIAVDSIVRRGTLMLQLGTANDRQADLVRSYSISMLDGSELPAWLQQAGPDLAIGKVPVNVERIAVRVTAVMSDGRVNSRDVVIETRTGEIQPVAPERRSEVVPLFSQQLANREALTGEEVQILGRALAGRRQ